MARGLLHADVARAGSGRKREAGADEARADAHGSRAIPPAARDHGGGGAGPGDSPGSLRVTGGPDVRTIRELVEAGGEPAIQWRPIEWHEISWRVLTIERPRTTKAVAAGFGGSAGELRVQIVPGNANMSASCRS